MYLENYLAANLPGIPEELTRDVRPLTFTIEKSGYFVQISHEVLFDFWPRSEWPIWYKKKWLKLGRGEGRIESRDGMPNRKPPKIIRYHSRPIRRFIYNEEDF